MNVAAMLLASMGPFSAQDYRLAAPMMVLSIFALLILCGDMPMVLTSRGDSARSKLASISLAVKMLFDEQQKRK